MNYTEDQHKALDAMNSWSKSPVRNEGDLVYTLNGAAGTGKTTIARAFINSLTMPNSKVAVTAPTHQAKKVIARATDFPADTIQRLLGLRPDVSLEDFNPNNPKFNPIADDKIKYYKVILVDESSMLNKAAVNLIKSKAKKYGVRILFMGDSYQLPPVGESISKVFTEVSNSSVLEQVVRQDIENPMTPILKMLRQDVKYSTQNGIAEMVKMGANMRGIEGFKCLTKDNFATALLDMYYSTEYEHDADHIRFLAYTNDSVEAWCDALRKRVQKDASYQITYGEKLIGYNTITDRRTNENIIENGESYEVVGIQKDESPQGVPGFYVKLATETGYTTTVFIIDRNDKAKFLELYTEKLQKAKANRSWQAYYNFKNNHLTMENIPVPGDRPIRKDIYYSYGSTVHKSQGATYTNTALNLKNIYINKVIAERNRLIYVALSRAKGTNLVLVK